MAIFIIIMMIMMIAIIIIIYKINNEGIFSPNDME